MHLKKGQLAPEFSVTDIFGNQIKLNNLKGKKVLLLFMRNTACPFCNFRLFQINKRHDDYQSAGLEIIVFMESRKDLILKSSFVKEQKLTIVSDPTKEIYKQYGVENSFFKAASTMFSAQKRNELKQIRELGLETIEDTKSDQTLIPADFLIDEDLIIREAYYGKNVGDGLSFEKIDELIQE
jgi:peroxiredoxin